MSAHQFGAAFALLVSDPEAERLVNAVNDSMQRFVATHPFRRKNRAEQRALVERLEAVDEKLSWPLAPEDRAALVRERQDIVDRSFVVARYLGRIAANDARHSRQLIEAILALMEHPATPWHALDQLAGDIWWLRQYDLCPDDLWLRAADFWPWLRVPNHYREEAPAA